MAILIIDCGTTNLRVELADPQGNLLASSKRAGGVRNTAVDGHNGRLKAALREAMEEVLAKACIPWDEVSGCYAYGMITSNMGLLEIPHLAAPVSAADLRNGVRSAVFADLSPKPLGFVPGVRNFADPVTGGNFSRMDMMRGEETEAVGLWHLLRPNGGCVLALPGSHNKFIAMDPQGNILGCMTSISGELLDAITHHTLLADAVEGTFACADDYDQEAALRGARECARSGLGRAAFAGRILHQLGGVSPAEIRSYLLGAVLAEDAAALRSFLPERQPVSVYVAGKEPLQTALCDVMKAMGIAGIQAVPPEITEQMGRIGMLRILYP